MKNNACKLVAHLNLNALPPGFVGQLSYSLTESIYQSQGH